MPVRLARLSLALLAAVLATPLLLVATPAPAGAVPTPSGFVQSIIASGLSEPTSMAFAPDGRLFITEQTGSVLIVKNGRLLDTPFVQLPTDDAGERGVLGLAIDPHFSTNHFVYVYYTATTPTTHNRVIRLTELDDRAAPGSQVTLLDLPTLGATNHNGGSMHFGPDGKLYIGVGENAVPTRAQDLSTPFGKMLRINSDGTIPSDNPFFNTPGAEKRVWAYGLRNPFTFAFEPGTGRMFIDDVGQDTYEEIDVGKAGANYGWPITEGPTSDPRFVSPLYWYKHDIGCAVTGGVFYRPSVVQFPPSYVGDYFFSDLCGGWIHRLQPPGYSESDFTGPSSSQPVDIDVAPDGSLWFLTRGPSSGAVKRLARKTAVAPPGWYLRNTNDSGVADVQFTYGSVGDKVLACDWNGDVVETPGVVNNGTWRLRNSNTAGPPDVTFQYGNGSDIPLCGDWNGDGVETPGVFRRGVFYLRNSNTTGSADITFGFGNSTDIPIVGDWNGDGVDTVGVFRSGVFYLRNTNTTGVADISFHFGDIGDTPLAGDWNGDTITTVGVHRGNVFYLHNLNETGQAEIRFGYGDTGDLPVVGDWNGDRFVTVGVVRMK